MNYSEIRAECLNRLEKGDVPDINLGELPRSIRKKGKHRARKRGEIWILTEDAMIRMINDVNATMFGVPLNVPNTTVSKE